MRKSFTEELEKLHIDFNKMGGLVVEQLNNVIKAFKEADQDLAHQVIDNDKTINEMEAQLEKDSILLIALQAPVTTDLRKIVTVLKASSDLERMGDHTKTIAKTVLKMRKIEDFSDIDQEISLMSKNVTEMINNVLDAFIQRDTAKVKEVAAMDATIDSMRDQIRKDIFKLSHERNEAVEDLANYIQLAQSLERIGDYAKNVAEWVLYLESGEITDLD